MKTRINPKKLLNSKWTAVRPKNKEKHFMVTELILDENDAVVSCVIESLMTRRQQTLPWQSLTQQTMWQQGWV